MLAEPFSVTTIAISVPFAVMLFCDDRDPLAWSDHVFNTDVVLRWARWRISSSAA